MARPFKETPILYGEDARRFQEAMDNVQHYTPEQMKEFESRVKSFCSTLTSNYFEAKNANSKIGW